MFNSYPLAPMSLSYLKTIFIDIINLRTAEIFLRGRRRSLDTETQREQKAAKETCGQTNEGFSLLLKVLRSNQRHFPRDFGGIMALSDT